MIFSLVFLICLQSRGQEMVHFKISKPYCLFNFLETATESRGTSHTFRDTIVSHTQNDNVFRKICDRFKNIRTDYTYNRDEFPETRRTFRSTEDLIIIALVNAATLDEFRDRAIGILPNSELLQLVNVLKDAAPYYDAIVWNKSNIRADSQQAALEAYAGVCSGIFKSFAHFYRSTWTADIPFTVALYPIPGKKGNTTATPHANSLCVGVLTDETDHIGRIGVVLHEMCHVLYDEQSNIFQHQLEKYFTNNHSPYALYAYNFFDEGLATALGNGWAYEQLNGKADTSAWYDNAYINGFGKALFPMVSEYLNREQPLDSSFVARAIELFAEAFPKAITDYSILLNKTAIYNDAATPQERGNLTGTIGKYFQVTSSYFSSPILHPKSIEQLQQSDMTQLVIISSNHNENIKALKAIFPELGKINFKKNMVLCFYDKKKRPVIILNAEDAKHVDTLLGKMHTDKYFDLNNPIQW